MDNLFSKTPKIIVFLLATLMLSGGISVMDSLYAQKRKEKDKKSDKENFRRPEPTHQIKPSIPSANRFQDDKVFLENADSLFRPPMDFEEKQIVKGNVVFRQGGMWMYCDSAYYFPQRNSLDAFGHVEMRQGDTLFVYSDKLFYDGGARKAVLTAGPSRNNVQLKDPKVTLTTDSLDYDLNMELGWYTRGGELRDDVNTLTSVYGEYSPSTKLAKFQDEVVLDNEKDGYRMFTEELEYNTGNHVATINTQTRIESANDTILTTGGRYNTATDNAVLTTRSTIIHRDSADNIVTLEGDSIIYDKATGISRAYMFRDILRNPQPMVLTDTARKMTLIGGYGEYNDSLQRALSTEYPLLLEYSRPDTLFLRADTILTYIRTEMVWPDSLARPWPAETRRRLQSYKTPMDVARDLPVLLPVLPYGFRMPGIELPVSALLGFPESFFAPRENRSSGSSEPVEENAAPIRTERLSKDAAGADKKGLKGEKSEVLKISEKLEVSEADGKPEVSEISEIAESSDTIPGSPDTIPGTSDALEMEDASDDIEAMSDSVAARPSGPRLDALGRDSLLMVPKDFHVARAIGRARFFNQDLQGVADTLIYHEFDSTLYMIRKPIVWNEQRQVYGNRIDVHFNDSVVDRAILPETGFMAEFIDEDFYNQLSGKKMTAYFEDNDLKRLDVDGNVEMIFLPMENDSTYNKLVSAEGSYLRIDMSERNLKKLKMWPEVTGTVTPLFLVKKSQMYLQGFKWFEILRPRREWYGDRWKWMDELGEVPDELDAYFLDNAPARKSSLVPSAEQLMSAPEAPVAPPASETVATEPTVTNEKKSE